MTWFSRLLRRNRMENELAKELRDHLERQVADHVAAGMSESEARRRAMIELGGLEQVKEHCRDARGTRWVEDTLRDLAYCGRTLRRSPRFAATAIVSLALAIGANTAIYSVLRATSFRASPLPDPERLAIIWTTPPGEPDTYEGTRIAEYLAWKEQTQAFDHMGTIIGRSSTLRSMRDGEPAEQLRGWRFSAGVFRALGVPPQLGRWFTEEDDRVGARSDVVILSDRLWRTHFAADPAVVGSTIVLDGQTTTIVGVMPPNFGVFDTDADFWIPSPFSPFQVESRGPGRALTILGHLKPGVSIEAAQADMEAIAARFAEQDPVPQKGRGIRVQPLDTVLFGDLRGLLQVLQGAVGFVLLIACANVAGLLLIRAISQQRQIAIRRALGASRFRIARLFLAESLILAVVGALLGTGLAWLGLRSVVAAAPPWLASIHGIEIDAGILILTMTVSVLTALGFGMVPTLGLPTSDLAAPLEGAPRTVTGGRRHRRLQSALVVAQVALTVVLLIGAGLMIKSFWHLQQVNLGLEPDQVLAFQTRLPANQYFRQVGVQNGFAQLDVSPVPAILFDRVRERLAQVPGVASVAGANIPPVADVVMQAPFRIEGRSTADGSAGANAVFSDLTSDAFASYALVTPDFFKTLQAPIVRGREFTDRDTANALPVAVINETMARRFWPNENPIGQRVIVTIVEGLPPREIVGVVGDMPTSWRDPSPAAALYVPHMQESLRSRVPYGQSRVDMAFFVRLNQPLSSVAPAVRRAVAEVDKSLTVSQLELMDDALARQISQPRDSMLLIGMFGAIALLLAIFGIYGIVAYGVLQRIREIGIRLALGARRSSVLGLVLRESTLLTIAGVVLGLFAAAGLTRYLQSLLFEVTPLDAMTFAAVPALFVLVVAIASYLPARRATRVAPQIVLRCE